ncbi:hypothetical protein, conserved [Eimeria tenella]|uniref:Uncharacterized protein n=1 Tax=Eimeria tenella TaxID=5802 RepID=U6KXD9_EIMTE|nr:hypothetical protein, conserved [Eimeria tenella]CDJ41598.1 hypothetical protein, conserved [Eimeria tenella]|eukprot:XP_013232348.1 hypothetical protein, conserved [Eimeria tenella]
MPTGNIIIDSVNRFLDELYFGKEEVQQQQLLLQQQQQQQRAAAAAAAAARPETANKCRGSTDYRAFLLSLCSFPSFQKASFPPLPAAVQQGRFAALDPFSRELLSQLSQEEAEVYLPYIHFHRPLLQQQRQQQELLLQQQLQQQQQQQQLRQQQLQQQNRGRSTPREARLLRPTAVYSGRKDSSRKVSSKTASN